MAKSIDVDPVAVAEAAQRSMHSTVEGGAPGAVPVGGLASLLDAAAFGFTTLLGARAGMAAGAVIPRGPVHFGSTLAGVEAMTATESASAARTASIPAPGL